ncbi:hypothetical protein K3495_g10642 [Podosphaera aphanis]|nr:hypothetical protein K3495_g10642 [Podosphaera aphanis]
MYDTQIVTGYRCPLDFYPFETIRNQIDNAKSNARGILPTYEVYPKPFDSSQIYHDIDQSWGWPIDGTLHHKATTSIIIDENFSVIGIIHLRNGRYFRCLITAKNKITPKFVGEAILQPAERVNQELVDIFQCGPTNFVYSEQLLTAASAAIQRFIRIRKERSNAQYPLYYKRSSANDDLYLWPMRLDIHGKYVKTTKFDKNENYYVIIDYFSDVYGLIMTDYLNQSYNCQRKLYPRRLIMESSIRSNTFNSAKRIKTN